MIVTELKNSAMQRHLTETTLYNTILDLGTKLPKLYLFGYFGQHTLQNLYYT